MTGSDLLPHVNDRHIEIGCSADLSGREFIGERESVEDDDEPPIEQSVKSEHRNAHGANDLKAGVVFLMNGSVEEAKAALDKLPLTEGGFMTFNLTPVGPLAPLGMLIQGR